MIKHTVTIRHLRSILFIIIIIIIIIIQFAYNALFLTKAQSAEQH